MVLIEQISPRSDRRIRRRLESPRNRPCGAWLWGGGSAGSLPLPLFSVRCSSSLTLYRSSLISLVNSSISFSFVSSLATVHVISRDICNRPSSKVVRLAAVASKWEGGGVVAAAGWVFSRIFWMSSFLVIQTWLIPRSRQCFCKSALWKFLFWDSWVGFWN